MQLTENRSPLKHHIRGKQRICVARYGFADASGGGCGTSVKIGNKILFQTGAYSDTEAKPSLNHLMSLKLGGLET